MKLKAVKLVKVSMHIAWQQYCSQNQAKCKWEMKLAELANSLIRWDFNWPELLQFG